VVRRLTHAPLEIAALIEETGDGGSGALVVFVGTVRDVSDGRAVAAITYTAHDALCEKVLADLEANILHRFPVRRCLIRHRLGRLAVGEASVLIVVRSAHREVAWEASRAAIDELKLRAPIWKEEHLVGGGSRRVPGVPLVTKGGSGERDAPPKDPFR